MTEDASPPVVVNGTAPAAASTTKGAGTTPTTTGHPMIVPPPEIRRIVEKTAEYYLRGGRALEDKIRVENAANVKFAFLNPNDPYHPYYRAQVEVVMRRSRGEEVEGGVAGGRIVGSWGRVHLQHYAILYFHLLRDFALHLFQQSVISKRKRKQRR